MSYIVMKYDDLSLKYMKAFTCVADFSLTRGMPVSMGLIGQSLALGDTFYKNKLKEWIKKGIEIWNHGYFHMIDEFSSASYEQQCQSISDTQKLMKTELGQTAVTFGSPHNNSTETTIDALETVAPEIKNYLFAVDGMAAANARQLLVRCDMEVATGKIDFDFFINNYNQLRNFPYMVIQGHPNFWSKRDFDQNEKIMEFLHDEGNIFVTPCQLPVFTVDDTVHKEAQENVGALLAFAEMHEKIAIYGAGEIGREMYRFLKANHVSPSLFVISDGQEKYEKEICDLPVIFLSEFQKLRRDYGIIVAMMPKFHNEITEMLLKAGVEYFCFNDKERYMALVHYLRISI